MDTVLLILGVLGIGAVIISAYVFLVTARDSASGDSATAQLTLVERDNCDRRVKKQFDFPMTVNGVYIPTERRVTLERRYSLA